MRALALVVVALLLTAAPAAAQSPPQAVSFDQWLGRLIAEVRARGFSEDLIQQTLVGLTPLERVIANDRRQAESVLTFDEYVRRRITPPIVERGRALAEEHRALLARVYEAYGVPPPIVLAIWAIESQYGRHRGDVPVFQALATLAWNPRRAPFFRGQLYDALAIVQRGHIDAASMLGSWAGAMGQPQFMPSSYLAYAVDFDNDGRRDIWGSYADTFASIANYLQRNGWRSDEPWGREVHVSPEAERRITAAIRARPSGCHAMREMTRPARPAEWQRLGVRLLDDGNLAPDGAEAALVRAGERRFLVGGNYDALLRYNCSHLYALTVAILADRIAE